MVPIRQGQALVMRVASSIAAVVEARAAIRYDDGSLDDIYIQEAYTTGSYAGTQGHSDQILTGNLTAIRDGQVVAVRVVAKTGTDPAQGTTALPSPGLVYVRLGLTNGGYDLASGYVYDGKALTLGEHTDAGPGGGPGSRRPKTLKANGAPATTLYDLFQSGTWRRWHGVHWLYNCSADAASRVLSMHVRAPFGVAVPTGMASLPNLAVWFSLTLTLTASEEGALYALPAVGGQVDNGTQTQQSAASAPSVFPLDVAPEALLAEISCDITDGNANDRDVIYGDVEEWLIPL